MRVLVAEDDPVALRLLQNYLAKWGHEVVSAGDGAEAWARFQEAPCPLVISDWMMPEMDGLELVRRIRAWQAARAPAEYVFIVLLTARAQKEDIVAGMEAGADETLAALEEAVRRLEPALRGLLDEGGQP